jgi:hypothetical protein
MRVRTLADPISVALALVFTVLSVANGLRIGFDVMDADERVYRNTLVAMQDGEGYYDAMRDALVAKEGEPPSQVRAIRPPTTYVALHLFPEGSWRWVVGIVYLAVCLLVWRLARPFDDLAGPAALVLAGSWCLGFSYYVFLHAELWGLPFLLGGALALRDPDRHGLAAGLLAIAAVVRELYGLPLVVGVVLARRRRPWIAAVAVVGLFYVVHYALASSVVVAGGHEAAFGNEDLTLRFLLRTISPGVGGWEYTVGVLTVVAGGVGLALAARRDLAARLLLPSAVVLAVAGVVATRVYWSAVWAVPMAAFVPAAFALVRRGRATATTTPST